MSIQSFDNNNDIKSKASHRETLKPQNLDIERESLVLPTGKGSFESEQSYQNSFDLNGEKASFYKKQELLSTASKALTDRINEEAILLSAKDLNSRAIFDRNPKEATEICGEDQDSYPNLSISNLQDQHQQECLKASSSVLRSHSFALKFQTNSFNSLQDLDFTRCSLGKHVIQALCCNYSLKSLKSLILTQNPLSNDDIKFISQTSNWSKLQKLILCEAQIDYDGVKWLAMNESWTSLKELDLSENPLIGDLGATSLYLNRKWKSLKTLSLRGCNVGTLGVITSRRRRNYTVLFTKDKTAIEVETQNFSFKKISFTATHDTQNPEKNLPTYPFLCSNRHLQNFKSTIRGGSPQGDDSNDSSGIDYSRLLTKFQQYKEKILNDTSLEKELKLFIEVQASTIPANHRRTNNENSSDMSQHLELSFDLRRHLLYCEGSEASKILLLTGQAGSGKSFFCKHLQRQLLSDWSQNPESEDRNWFPIYVELSSLKNPKSEAISETLSRELSLTNEEILLLQASKQSNLDLPRVLFIFDGYDEIENNYVLNTLGSRQDFLDNNFSMLNKIKDASWKDAKFIITCREENLQKVQRRDMLFAPLVNSEAAELLIVPGSFLQRKIEHFCDEQITCFLRKYYLYVSKEMIEEKSSWNQVKILEKMIDDHKLREIARIPFMLGVICHILPKFVINELGQINDVKAIYPQRLNKLSLIEFFVDEVIRSIAKESLDASNILESNEEHKYVDQGEDYQQQMDLQIKEIRRKAQNFALKLRGYATNYSADEYSQHENLSALKLHPLVKSDNNHSRVKFRYPFLLEFFVAKSLEEEISQIVPSITEDNFKIKKQLLINQRLLTSEASDAIVILSLSDAFKDERLISSQLMNLIYLSREKELNYENNDREILNASHSSSQTPFTNAASNAITILNVAGYNFGSQDLTNISIRGANLSFGEFEGTNFANSSLQGVDFTGAWLKGTNFVKANLESVDFGAIRRLKLQKENIKNIAYSPDGKYFAVDVGAETVIFEVVDMQRSHFKETRRIPGYFLQWGELGGKKVVIIEEQELEDDQNEKLSVRFCIWDVASGQSLEKLNVPMGNRKFLNFDPDRKEVIAFGNQMVQKYDIASQSWIQLPVKIWNDVKTRNLFAKNSNMLLVGDRLRNTTLCSLITGKAILKQRQRVTSCKLNSGGQKIVAGTSHGFVHISDCVRGYIIKSLANQKEVDDGYESIFDGYEPIFDGYEPIFDGYEPIFDGYEPIFGGYEPIFGGYEPIFDCSFRAEGKQILARIRDELTLQDVVDSQSTRLTLNSAEPNNYTYCLHPDGQQVALVGELYTISFQEFPTIADLSTQTPAIRGTNNKGLNLQGVIANSSFKLSEENIAHLQNTGDYGIFHETMIKKLFSNSLADSEDVREVALIGEKLAPIHARIIGSDLLWINLQRLDLSRNHIGEDGGKAIGSNITWAHLEELILMHTEIGDETAKAISNNQNFQKIKKLRLAFNKIGDIGAESMGKNEIWISLQTLDLSSNQISDKHILIFLCSNKTWEHLQSLLLVGNPTLLETSDFCKILGEIASKSLKMLVLPQAKFEQALLQYLKYSAIDNVLNLSLAKRGYNDIYAEIIAANTTWTNLKKLDLKNNFISDKGGIKIGSNTSWINLEELDISYNNLRGKSAAALGDNTTWSKLRVLNLNGNKIGSKGSYAIGNNKIWIELQMLELQDNLIESQGVVALCQNKTWTKLQTLNLEKNLVDIEGAAGLARNTSWINLQTLHLSSNSIRDKGAAELASNTSWINLQTLHLSSNKIGAEGAAELARNTSWINLQTLYLYKNSIADKGAAGLARNTSWINLQTLHLEDNSISAEGAAELARNTSWINLQTLHLEDNSISAEGAAELARNRYWVNLQTLDLRNNSIDAQAATELARNASWVNLQTLNLHNNPISDKGAAELARNKSWVNLKTLDLGENLIGAEGAEELARNTSWINLQTLDLSRNSIDDKGAAELARNASWINLQTLDLRLNSIGDKGAAELARNTCWINLQTLYLDSNSIGDKGAAELARNTCWINLQTLYLDSNSIGDKGAAELARNTCWINLQTLYLDSNSIGDKGAAELARNTSWINLQTLNLDSNKISAEGAAELARNTSWINLQTFGLRLNSIGDKGAAELARNTSWINLQTLNLNSNKIGAEGAAELARNTSWINLQTLDLSSNSIDDKGAAELGRNISWINLQTLDLRYNSIGAEGAAELARNISWINLQTLNLSSNKIDGKGAAELGRNTSRINLQTLDLGGNSIGAEGAAELGRNTSWINLQTLDLTYNSIGDKGAAELARNTTWPKSLKIDY